MRLIDADLLREHLFVTESRTGGSREEQAYEQGWDDALKSVMAYEPTVYAVKVVRCEDCKHRDPEDGICDCGHDILWQLPRDDNWFCADGERRKP